MAPQHTASRLGVRVFRRFEDGFDGPFEHASDSKSQRKAWIVASRLDGVDGLSRDVKARSKLGL